VKHGPLKGGKEERKKKNCGGKKDSPNVSEEKREKS